MKNQPVLFIILASAIVLGGCNLKEKRAKKYHDDLLHSVQAVIDSSLEYGDAVQSHRKTRVTSAYEQYHALVGKTIEKVQTAGNFEGDSTLQHYSMELLGFYKTSLEQGFKPLFSSIKAEEFNSDESNTADSLYENLTMMEARYWERFNWAEKKFSSDNKLGKLEEK